MAPIKRTEDPQVIQSMANLLLLLSGDASIPSVVQEPQEITNSYNPEWGVAYYFTPHANQIRKQPVYCIDQAKKIYDDVPCVDEICRKKFPSVSYGGFGYIFLWFCPIHGHCYGFHLISGGEGRKDPFSSLFKHLPKAPTDIFYDFACQLSDYCLNREPQYFYTQDSSIISFIALAINVENVSNQPEFVGW